MTDDPLINCDHEKDKGEVACLACYQAHIPDNDYTQLLTRSMQNLMMAQMFDERGMMLTCYDGYLGAETLLFVERITGLCCRVAVRLRFIEAAQIPVAEAALAARFSGTRGSSIRIGEMPSKFPANVLFHINRSEQDRVLQPVEDDE